MQKKHLHPYINAKQFKNMMNMHSLKITSAYLREEGEVITSVLKQTNPDNIKEFVSVGDASLIYSNITRRMALNYTVVDPLIKLTKNDDIKRNNISIINQELANAKLKNKPNKVIALIFNLVSYLTDPIDIINKHIKPNDIVIISTWSKNTNAIKLRKKYFSYLNKLSNSKLTYENNMLNLSDLNLDAVKHLKKYTIVKQLFTDIAILYTGKPLEPTHEPTTYCIH